MPRSRKSFKLTLQTEAHESRNGVSASSPSQRKTRPPTIPFSDSFEYSFRNWLNVRKNRDLFDSAKWIRYRWSLEDSDGEICGTKAEKTVNFNERCA